MLCSIPPLVILHVATDSLLFFALLPLGRLLLTTGRLLVFVNLLLLGKRVPLSRFILGWVLLGRVLGLVL
jgi:hypothetical protein